MIVSQATSNAGSNVERGRLSDGAFIRVALVQGRANVLPSFF